MEKKSTDLEGPALLAQDNLVAWCIVPFDSVERGPEERAAMLEDLGFRQFAYDWREKHLPSFPDEIKALKAHGIGLKSVWFWVDGPEPVIDANNARMLQMIGENQVQTEFWLGVNQRVFAGLSEEETLTKAVEVVDTFYRRARALGCKIALYNHGDWFGEPANQIKVIQALGYDDIGIIYNFHHAHLQLDNFPELLKMMQPYLTTVNLNGMRAEGPKILTIGEGDRELTMLRQLAESGFQGNIGILGHIETEDVKTVLTRNLAGLAMLRKELAKQASN